MRTGFVDDPLFDRHRTGPGHPESPKRLATVRNALQPLNLQRIAARDATRKELERAHDPDYLDHIQGAIERGADALDADTKVCGDSWAAAVRAAGAALALGDAWLAGEIDAGFSCARPPGHHAERGKAMGFCLLGNVAILALALKSAGKRVAIVDWDVHHGNGTQDILRNVPEIGFCSLHQWPLWPGTGRAHETGSGNILNLPMEPGSGNTEYAAVFETRVLPWLDERSPDVVLLSAGFDAHASDPLAQQTMTAEGFATLMSLLATRPVLAVLEGGYDLEALGESVHAAVKVLVEATDPRA